MNRLAQNSIHWIEQRTGLQTVLRHFLRGEIPASTGWPQVLGSVALFLFLNQIWTGILLSFNYTPGTDSAYRSLNYIMAHVAGGRLVRGLHHWGASLMIVVIVVHISQVFLYGAYKKPREMTWISGVFLLLFTLAFGLTGYLLPWDNKAYWGTVVTAHLLDGVPVVGIYLQSFIGATEHIGVLTVSRFYALHTLILPALMVLILTLHLYLVRRHGVTPSRLLMPKLSRKRKRPSLLQNPERQSGATSASKAFYPEQAFRDALAIFVAFVLLFLSAALIDVPLERVADPTDTTYVPRPEWYFLFLFQALKYFRGPLETLGTIGLPSLAILILFAVPFIDRGHMLRVTQRTTAFAVVVLVFAGWSALTVAAIASTPERNPSPPPDKIARGAELYAANGCASCHGINGNGGRVGPSLNGVRNRRSRDWIARHFVAPATLTPGSMMPPYEFSDEQRDAIVDYLFSLPD